jgi:hypothetical protein
MITWTLVMILWGGTRPVVVNVPGFSSQTTCREAADQLHQRWTGKLDEVSRVCLEVK